MVGSLRSLRWAWGTSGPDSQLLTSSVALSTDAPQASGAPTALAGLGTQQELPASSLPLPEREGSLWLSSVTPSVLWDSEGKLMRVWRPVRKVTASFIVKDKSQAE